MFTPYRKNNVNPQQYVQVEIPKLGKVWASIFRHSLEAQEVLGEVFGVEVLGTGEQPGISFVELPAETRQELHDHAKQNGLIGSPKSAVFAAVGAVKTPKKAASSRENGKKGGRPKTSPLTRQEQQREYQRKRRAAAKAKSE